VCCYGGDVLVICIGCSEGSCIDSKLSRADSC
jgi:hypothetical protein